MVVKLLQTDIKWNDITANRNNITSLLGDSKEADLIVLPEMYSTGFAVKPNEVVVEQEESVVEWMRQMASKHEAAIAGSVAIGTDDGAYYNRLYFVKPDGSYAFYDKRHLFTYGGEQKHYNAGNQKVIVEWCGVKFLLQVCYDLRFPVFSRNRLTESPDGASALYDCCLYVANWPESRRRVWDALLTARAIENQCYVLGVNRIGDDNLCHYNGGTQVVDAYGRVVAKVSDNEQGCIEMTLDIEKLTSFRKKFPVLADADIISV